MIKIIKHYNKTPETLVLSQCREIPRRDYKQKEPFCAEIWPFTLAPGFVMLPIRFLSF